MNVDCKVLLVAAKFSKCNFYFNIDWGIGETNDSHFSMFILTLRKTSVKAQSVPTILSRVVDSNLEYIMSNGTYNISRACLLNRSPNPAMVIKANISHLLWF